MSTSGVVQVDLSDELLDLSGGELTSAVAQIVFTASEIPGAESVLIRVDGATQEWPDGSGAQHRGPLTTYDFIGWAESAQPAFPVVSGTDHGGPPVDHHDDARPDNHRATDDRGTTGADHNHHDRRHRAAERTTDGSGTPTRPRRGRGGQSLRRSPHRWSSRLRRSTSRRISVPGAARLHQARSGRPTAFPIETYEKNISATP